MSEAGTKKNDYRLDRSPGHLLRRVQQRAADIYAELSKGEDLTQRQFTVLFAVSEEEGLSQTDLVTRTGIDRSTLADMIARLVARELLERRRTAADARANAVSLTEKGRGALDRALAHAAAADDALVEGLPKAARAAFIDHLHAILNANAADAAEAAAGAKKKKKKKKKKKAD